MDPSPPASIAFSGTVTRDEFDRIHARLLPVWARWYVLYPVVGTVALAFAMRGARVSALVVDVVAFFVLLPIAMAVFTRRARTRAWKQFLRLYGRLHGAVTADGIEWNTERSAARFEWARIERVTHGDGLVLAFLSPRNALFFPRSFFATEADWTAFNDVIAAACPPRAQR